MRKEATVGVFRRSKSSDESHALGSAEEDGAEALESSQDAVRERGPWDVDEVEERGARIDLGALWIPGRDGMELRMELDQTSGVVTAAAVTLTGSTLQMQVFAAPRSEGIWDGIRTEIAESVTQQGGSVDDLPGPFGRELLARLPVRTEDGRTGSRPARFIGHDGPRWFLRGVLTGRAAVDPQDAVALEGLFADVVVLRGTDARVPRELIALTMPQARGPLPESGPAPDSGPAFNPLERGPEITEVH
jgi:hypothetical protein